MDHFAYCEALVREGDKDRFLATLFAPEKARRQLFALYAFDLEIARVSERVTEPLAGEIRLQWWRDVLAGTRAGEARAHPPAAALFDTVVRARLPVHTLLDLVDARGFDLQRQPIENIAALEEYGRKTASTLIDLAATILDGQPSVAVAAAAEPAGIAYAITRVLRGPRRRFFLPLETLRLHGARTEDALGGKVTPQLCAALGDLRDVARMNYQKYVAQRADLPAEVRPAFLPLALVPLYLRRLERAHPFGRIEAAHWRRQWALWREARRP